MSEATTATRERMLYLLNALCEDSLEVPLAHVDLLESISDYEQSAQFKELRDLILALVAERDRAVVIPGLLRDAAVDAERRTAENAGNDEWIAEAYWRARSDGLRQAEKIARAALVEDSGRG